MELRAFAEVPKFLSNCFFSYGFVLAVYFVALSREAVWQSRLLSLAGEPVFADHS